jgi:hypothetical protein
LVKKASTKHFLQGLGRVLYHVLLVAMSAGVVFFLPTMVSIVARDFWTYWALVEKQNIFLVSVEIALALLLVLFFNYLGSSWGTGGSPEWRAVRAWSTSFPRADS